ncbi:porin, putative [Vibrio cholerae]|nr:porin, putative [Vibrio cholerae]
MDKMFKRTLLGAAVAMAAVGVQAAQLTDNVQLYGQAPLVTFTLKAKVTVQRMIQ